MCNCAVFSNGESVCCDSCLAVLVCSLEFSINKIVKSLLDISSHISILDGSIELKLRSGIICLCNVFIRCNGGLCDTCIVRCIGLAVGVLELNSYSVAFLNSHSVAVCVHFIENNVNGGVASLYSKAALTCVAVYVRSFGCKTCELSIVKDFAVLGNSSCVPLFTVECESDVEFLLVCNINAYSLPDVVSNSLGVSAVVNDRACLSIADICCIFSNSSVIYSILVIDLAVNSSCAVSHYAAVENYNTVEVCVSDLIEFVVELEEFLLDSVTVDRIIVCAVSGLVSKGLHSLKNGMCLCESTFKGLNHRDTVLCVLNALVDTCDL